jgi:hypothetical protein
MLKFTDLQLNYLKEILKEKEVEEMIGLPDEDGGISRTDKELLEVFHFFYELNPGDTIKKIKKD